MNPRSRGVRSTVLLLACAAAVTALGACSDDAGDATDPAAGNGVSPSPASSTPGTEPATEPTAEPTQPEPSASPTPPYRLIGYAGGESPGVVVHERADAKRLHGAPAGFRRFIGRLAQRIADESTCRDAAVGVTVQTLRTDGYAVGGVNDCGGYAALWAVVDGRWRQIEGAQEMWKCTVLKRYAVPSDVAGTRCYDYAHQEEHPYHQA